MKTHPTDGEMVLACWRREGITTAGVTRIPEKSKTKISIEAECERREKALDEAIENTFPASDPVSSEQPVYALGP
jgi:hypothetical protein